MSTLHLLPHLCIVGVRVIASRQCRWRWSIVGRQFSTMCLLLHLGNPDGGSELWELSGAVNVRNVLHYCFLEMLLALHSGS